MIEQDPILVTGAARSGSGIVAGAFVKCGAFGGIMTNKRGLYENDKVRDLLVKPYLQDVGVDPLGQYPLPDTTNMLIPRHWRTQVQEIMREEGYTGGPWMYKDSRIGLMWPIWHYAFPNAKWILVRRRTGDIVDSCKKTAYMAAYKNQTNLGIINVPTEDEGWKWWIHEQEKRWVELMNEGVNVKVVWPERMVDGDYRQFHETLEWAGLKWNPNIYNFVDTLLWTSRKKKGG